MSEPGRCLVVTGLRLDRLSVDRHGVYQRFRMLLDASVKAGFELDIISAAPPGHASEAELRQQIASDVSRHWGLEVRTLPMLRYTPDRRTPYILQEVMACLHPRFSTGFRAAVAGGQLPSIREALRQRPSLILAHRLSIMTVLSCARDLPPSVFDMDDIEHVVSRRWAKQLPPGREKWLTMARVPAIKVCERQAVRRAHRTLVCSEADALLLRRLAGVSADRVLAVPNGVDVAKGNRPRNSSSRRPVVLMVGVFTYKPNAEGAAFFVREVWPRVLSVRPDAQLCFVGAGGEHIPMPSPRPSGVIIRGFVDELEEVYGEASVVVCPILTGGGTRIKLLEAALHGLPIVSTTLGAEGLALKSDAEILVRDDPQGMADACLDLLANPAHSNRLGLRARQAAITLYDRENITQKLAGVMRELTNPSAL